MRVEIWADVVCGWAHIGKRRLEKALASWEGEPVEVVWRPYRIDPSAPARAVPMADLLRDPVADEALRACAPGLSPTENRARVAGVAAAEGLGEQWGSEWRASTLEAHRLIALAYEKGGAELQDRVVERVLRAHFVDVQDISDLAVLTAIAAEAGLAEEAGYTGEPSLETLPGAELVRELLLVGKAKGVRTSPTIVANGLALEGAQPPEALREFLEDAARHTPRRLPAEVERLRLAESLLDQRDPLGTLTLLRPLMAEHGDDRGVRLLAARAYFASAQLNRARTALESLVAESPDDSYARHLLGRTLQRQGRHEEAASHLTLAAAMTPDYGTD
ncbi:putative DsbA family dithiol-disulfide isomerase [Nonomuraea thailandensis]|uniref:DsbA family dithiol-disulfide isomerase n=1 Tax=Nonomuraea thailandensis TaxID=1188745 RepID=A0A9X2K414_9ACTN|nr:DsbA family protein [Nonomuraea thailandensis]MCP2356126.1 putative DsbA family dithiol-disulfide isomerase [Nonomuraea thailandensis]